MEEENLKLKAKLTEIQKLVEKQAEVEALWLEATHIETAFVQQGLRHLHAVIENYPEPDRFASYLEQ